MSDGFSKQVRLSPTEVSLVINLSSLLGKTPQKRPIQGNTERHVESPKTLIYRARTAFCDTRRHGQTRRSSPHSDTKIDGEKLAIERVSRKGP
ncbi:MAG: hypothetical protein KDB26_15375, partial [Microthrixaceae bacterium]|nr:hypothetical protein [Microthrixaceae bacterium]